MTPASAGDSPMAPRRPSGGGPFRRQGNMGAGHAHHHHAQDERRVLLALILTGSFMTAEAVGGILSGSLALLADAGHMLADTAARALSWYAFRIGRRGLPPGGSLSHEEDRWE